MERQSAQCLWASFLGEENIGSGPQDLKNIGSGPQDRAKTSEKGGHIGENLPMGRRTPTFRQSWAHFTPK